MFLFNFSMYVDVPFLFTKQFKSTFSIHFFLRRFLKVFCWSTLWMLCLSFYFTYVLSFFSVSTKIWKSLFLSTFIFKVFHLHQFDTYHTSYRHPNWIHCCDISAHFNKVALGSSRPHQGDLWTIEGHPHSTPLVTPLPREFTFAIFLYSSSLPTNVTLSTNVSPFLLSNKIKYLIISDHCEEQNANLCQLTWHFNTVLKWWSLYLTKLIFSA